MERAGKLFLQLHAADQNKMTQITENFYLKKINEKIEDTLLIPDHFNLVYFDAFAPGVQPELWTEEIFAKISASLKSAGVLVTYSSKGSVKRALLSAGFTIEKIPGPAGKREFIRARKI
jgi:tRNA U34 5-methylaminomethyl-2-thiouridine-forming methyltransferase MnmC